MDSFYFNGFLVFVLSILSHFVISLQYPDIPITSEAKTINATKYYIKKQYFYDDIEPFNNLLPAFNAKVVGYRPLNTQNKRIITTKTLGKLRLLPRIYSSLVPFALYFVSFMLTGSSKWSLAGSILFLGDNMFISTTLFATANGYFLLFNSIYIVLITSVLSHKITQKPKIAIVLISSVLLGLSLSMKFNSIFNIIPLAYILALLFKRSGAIILLVLCTFISFFVCYLTYYVHFSKLTKPGPGCSHHIPLFCHNLEYGFYHHKQEAMALFGKMLINNFNPSLYKQDENVNPLKWPLCIFEGNIVYEKVNKIISQGGSFLFYFAVLISILLFIILLIKFSTTRKAGFLLYGYLFNYIPYIFFDYYAQNEDYLLSLMYGSIMISFVLHHYFGNNSTIYFISLLFGVVSFFISFPLTYGK